MDSPDNTKVVVKKPRTLLFLSVLGLLVVLVGVIVVHQVLPPADFSGPATGTTKIVVKKGDSVALIANTLKSDGVISSVDRFISLCSNDSRCNGLQPGTYKLGTRIPVKLALDQLLNPANRIFDGLLIREGLRANEIIDLLAAHTGLPATAFEKAMKHPKGLGLPDWADGKFEGFLFPASYDIPVGATPTAILKLLISTANHKFEEVGLTQKAKTLGLSPKDLLTIASIIQAEAHPRDFPKVARVILNRLAQPMRLQMDSTVAYGLGRKQVILSTQDLGTDTPYNTYLHDGLPPGPINNPGISAISAAGNPASGDWLYFITVNLDTQETKFTNSYDTFLQYKDEFLGFCSSNPGSC